VTLLNELIIRAMIKMKMASLHRVGLANVILDEMAMPELLQRNVTAENLADALVAITMDSPARQRQCDAFARLDAIMEIGTAVPSERVAAAVIAMARRHESTGS
jgi:lipid-A-disaccharide synthase